MNVKVLTARGVALSFGGVRCLDGVDLDLDAGRVHVVLGRSGAGKSTLIRILAGVVAPAGGVVRIGDRELPSRPGGAFPEIGYLMQRPERQFFADTVRGEVAFALERSEAPEEEVVARVRGTLSALCAGGEKLLDRAPWSLSRGEQRLVAFASVNVFSPRILLLDEPLSGLDPRAGAAARAAIRRAASDGAAILMTGHELPGIGELADDLSILVGGRLLAANLAVAGDREMLGREGFALPPEWEFLATRLDGFWGTGRWREPVERLAEDLPGAPAGGPWDGG